MLLGSPPKNTTPVMKSFLKKCNLTSCCSGQSHDLVLAPAILFLPFLYSLLCCLVPQTTPRCQESSRADKRVSKTKQKKRKSCCSQATIRILMDQMMILFQMCSGVANLKSPPDPGTDKIKKPKMSPSRASVPLEASSGD